MCNDAQVVRHVNLVYAICIYDVKDAEKIQQ